MVVVDSDVLHRCSKPTPRKRIVQVGMIEEILSRTESLEGDWFHTAGPGKVIDNYVVYSRGVSKNSKYIMIEANEENYNLMNKELNSLNKLLAKQGKEGNIFLINLEIFFFINMVLKNKNHPKILVVDADLCQGLPQLIYNGILEDIEELFTLQTEQFFFSITYSYRNGNRHQGKVAESKLKNLIEKSFNAEKIYECSYADGTPMNTITWEYNPAK